RSTQRATPKPAGQKRLSRPRQKRKGNRDETPQSRPHLRPFDIPAGFRATTAQARGVLCAATCAPLRKGTFRGEGLGGSPAVFEVLRVHRPRSGVGVLRLAGCGQPACGPWRLDVAPGAQALVDSSPTVAGRLVYAGRNTGEVLAWPAGPCGTFRCT